MTFDYYWIPVGTAAVAVVLFAPGHRTRTGALALASAYLAWACSPLGWGPAGGLCLLALVGLFLPLCAPARPVTTTARLIYGAGTPRRKDNHP